MNRQEYKKLLEEFRKDPTPRLLVQVEANYDPLFVLPTFEECTSYRPFDGPPIHFLIFSLDREIGRVRNMFKEAP